MAKSYKALKKQFDELSADTKSYLHKLEGLLAGSDKYDIALAYIFMKLEEGHHRALKCGLIRRHKCNSAKADEALEQQHFTREYFRKVFKNVLGKDIPSAAREKLASAEGIRDKQIHGKSVSDADLRQGISDALTYISNLGEFVKEKTNKNPFGDLRGLAGKTQLLDEATSYWLLKGVGLYTDQS
ncbi:hypothetical protein [Rhodovulum sp. ES.010]|uniref:hypothetical protein n=1 Tax=Rhodovulum sp. ES.010 TaxID=1882821 RepID=UPI0011154728|nr:hypothetical protein [Rhodovulum sp. ES.010]